MSFMRPENITPRETDPRDSLGKFYAEYNGTGAEIVLGIMGDLDPLRIYTEDEADYDDKRSRYYIEYATRFMEQLGERKLQDLSEDEVRKFLEESLGGITGCDVDEMHSHLVQTIETLRSQEKK